MDFSKFEKIISAQYEKISSSQLFLTDDSDGLWSCYLNAFPQGTNDVFETRTEHDCNCCKQFVRRLGALVSVDPNTGERTTIWDTAAKKAEYPYNLVAEECRKYVLSKQIIAPFYTGESSYGQKKSAVVKNGKSFLFYHFHGNTPKESLKPNPGEAIGSWQSAKGVMARSLYELETDVISEVIAVVEEDATAIYRAQEHLPTLKGFLALTHKFNAIKSDERRDDFIWANCKNPHARIRNSAIGTLIEDLSEGKEWERAIASFEAKVAPSNYKRPKSIITPKMVEAAVAKIDELGYRASLERRHARIEDVSVRDVLFVDRSIRPHMKDALVESLMASASKGKVDNGSNFKDISLDEFIEDIMPQCSTIEVLLENRHENSLMTITAPKDPDAPSMFTWGNGFAWAYNGNNADSDITSRVKSAGGNTDAYFRVSLGWYNTDDLDLHCRTPQGVEIYFGNKCGILDVDMNAHSTVRNAVENMSWSSRPRDGVYKFFVKNFRQRENVDTGCEVEVYGPNFRESFSAERVTSSDTHAVIEVTIKDGMIAEVKSPMKRSSSSKNMWGLDSQKFHKVQTIMTSPNHWGDRPHGNKHYLFVLEGCKNPDPVRSMFNEFLKPDLHEHRKVMEAVASKTQVQYDDNQLSGLGLSSTRKSSLKIKTDKGQFNVTTGEAQ